MKNIVYIAGILLVLFGLYRLNDQAAQGASRFQAVVAIKKEIH